MVNEGTARELADDEARVQALAGASAQDWSMDEVTSVHDTHG
jgi:hypothetical protein